MKHFLVIYTFVALSLTSLGFSAEPSSIEQNPSASVSENQKQEITKISEAFGFLMGKNLESIGVKFDIQSVIKGLQNAAEGKTSPMTEMECIQAITAAQENAFKEEAAKNLSLAEEFLKENKTHEGIVCLEEDKIQYKVEKEGTGEALEANSTPLIRYTGKFLDGTMFGTSSEDEPLSLEEVISGLKAGLIGMKEGEKRTIYIHPDCAYGTKGSLPPNSLLTFEIEIVKAEAPHAEEIAPELIPADKETLSEIALPEHNIEHIR